MPLCGSAISSTARRGGRPRHHRRAVAPNVRRQRRGRAARDSAVRSADVCPKRGQYRQHRLGWRGGRQTRRRHLVRAQSSLSQRAVRRLEGRPHEHDLLPRRRAPAAQHRGERRLPGWHAHHWLGRDGRWPQRPRHSRRRAAGAGARRTSRAASGEPGRDRRNWQGIRRRAVEHRARSGRRRAVARGRSAARTSIKEHPMARPIVVFNCARNYPPGSLESDMPRLMEACEVRLTEAKDGPDLARELADAQVLVARRDYVGRNTLALVDGLRGVVTPGVGIEKVDVAAATELGIVVANSPGNSITMSEATLLLMLAVAKQMPAWIEKARTGTEPTLGMRGMELHGKTVGLVGLGRIGRLVAGLARAFGMRVLAYDPYVTSSDLAELTSLERVLAESDFVSCHPVLTPETFHLINAERLAQMKPTAYLINTSRGG